MKLSMLLALAAVLAVMILRADANEIGFIEDFSLARDRSEALKQLIPGTEDYYYFHCLNAQHQGDDKAVNDYLALWIKRHGYTQRVREIQNRQALFDYAKHPDASLKHIRNELNLRFDHRRELPDAKTDYPTALDPERISIPRLMNQAFKRYKNLQGIEAAGLYALEYDALDPDRRRDFLHRLKRPDIPNLASLVVEDLRHSHSGGFGSHSIHSQMLKSQLDQCLKLAPELLDNAEFIRTYLTKLAPSEDAAFDDLAARKAHLLRLKAFVTPLSPAHNTIKANVFYWLLEWNLKREIYDRDLFMEYIRLPRNADYIDPDYAQTSAFRSGRADLGMQFFDVTGLPPVENDEALVRQYLSHFFIDATDYKAFAEYIRDGFLKDVFAETKIVHQLGDPETWYSMIAPNRYKAIKERVDIDFAPGNPEFFATDEPVKLDAFVKNVETLIIKIFEINTFNYYRMHEAEVDAAVELDGLSATHERVVRYDETPFHRVRRTFEFPEIADRGVYVIDFIGNGKNSRAVIRRGKLWAAERTGPEGHEFRIFDELNQKRPGAVIWMEGREYRPGDDGVVTIPFSTQPGRQTMILKDGGFCALSSFQHAAESYRLRGGFHVDRESLIRNNAAKVLLRPTLTVNQEPVSLSLLENVRLSIETADRKGNAALKEVPDLVLHEDRETVVDFNVPEGLSHIRFSLQAKVRNLSRNKTETLSDQAEFSLNAVDGTLHVKDVFLSHADGEYRLRVLGKNGEPIPDQPVNLDVKHRFFKDLVQVPLQTDAHGMIRLGTLPEISWIRAAFQEGVSHTWTMAEDKCRRPGSIHAPAGQAIHIPFSTQETTQGTPFTLLETRGMTYVADRTDAVREAPGYLNITGLSSGDYELFLKPDATAIQIRVTKGDAADGLILSDNRILETRNTAPLSIEAVEEDKDALRVTLGNVGEFTRLHVFAGHFMPEYHPFSGLSGVSPPEPYELRVNRPESHYVAGRDIGDEYRYILDRKYAKKFPGNMLDRPELILNPWSVRKTDTGLDQAAAGEAMASRAPRAEEARRRAKKQAAGKARSEGFSSYDFLARPSALLLNLKPDSEGRVVIDRKDLGGRPQIHLVAVDPLNAAYREVSLAEDGLKTRDLRLARSLDPETRFTEQKEISTRQAGETFRLENAAAAEFEIYDSLDKVYDLLQALNPAANLDEFRFILDWPALPESEKAEKYAKYACHELHFFLYHKDPDFFERVVRPYLANKKDKTFMDDWLLGADLTPYLESWAFSQLNIVEKILLGRRSPRDGDGVRRHVQDLFDMITPDVDIYNRLFDTALKGRALQAPEAAFGMVARDDSRGIELPESFALADDLLEQEADMAAPAAEPMPSAPRSAPAPAEMKAKAEVMKKGGKKDFFQRRADKEALERPFFRKPDKTEEWAENNYYKLPIVAQNAGLVTVNAFWMDFADSDPAAPFLSKNIMYAHNSFTEIMLAVSVLDLPFKAGEHETNVEKGALTVRAKSPMIVFHKEIAAGKKAGDKGDVLVSQNIFDPSNRYRYEGAKQFDKFIDEECRIRTPYGCRVVLSNPTSARRKINALFQIPEGALPINNGFYTQGVPLRLEPYATETMEYYFYFPETGAFPHYPAQAARNQEVIASAEARSLKAVTRLSRIDTESWDHISQNGTPEQVLAFLDKHNLNRVDLGKIAFRMKDRKFFNKTLHLLRSRHAYHPTLWSYGVYHNAPDAIAEFLGRSAYARQCGLYIDTRLLSLDPVARKAYQHLEYRPLIHARAHQLGKERKILNDRFFDQYQNFMRMLSYRPELDGGDLMGVTYYLLLQDRVNEAMAYFARIDKQRVDAAMQYDYLEMYLDFYRGDTAGARQIANKYKNYPAQRWEKMFRAAAMQLDELEGKAADVADEESREQVQTRLAAQAPSFDFDIEARQVRLNYQNLETCRINYYPMDIELLFSRNPFVKHQTDFFGVIRPNLSRDVDLQKDQNRIVFDLPEEFHNSNLVVEIAGAGVRKSEVYYANSLNVQFTENYGQLRVTHAETRAALPMVYVKVYARNVGGGVEFYKDGYTDLRGRFDYASLSTDELDRVETFSVLVLSDEFGAVIQEVEPPKR